VSRRRDPRKRSRGSEWPQFYDSVHISEYDLVKPETSAPIATFFMIVSLPDEATAAVCFSILRVSFADSS
jgi:hypothetical protein